MDTGLAGKRALITGGGSGIGRAIALALADEGVHVAVASNKPGSATIGEIAAKGVRALDIAADVSDEPDVRRMVATTIEALGGIDLYVNNAAGVWHEPITKLTAEGWRRSIDTNLAAFAYAGREVARHMIPRRSGSILVIGSTARFCPPTARSPTT